MCRRFYVIFALLLCLALCACGDTADISSYLTDDSDVVPITDAASDNTAENTAVTTVPVTECPHAFGEWTVSKAATCTEKGEEKRTCTCGAQETRELAAVAHTYGEWAVSKAATCTEKGEEKRTCACGAAETRELPMVAHTYGEWAVSKAATCTEKGEEKLNLLMLDDKIPAGAKLC